MGEKLQISFLEWVLLDNKIEARESHLIDKAMTLQPKSHLETLLKCSNPQFPFLDYSYSSTRLNSPFLNKTFFS